MAFQSRWDESAHYQRTHTNVLITRIKQPTD